MVLCNSQFIVKICCYILAPFCLISPNLQLSNKLSLLLKLYASFAIGCLLHLFQYYIIAKIRFWYPKKSVLFITLDLLDFSVPALAVLAAIIYSTFLKQKVFIQFYNKFAESDTFLGERYSNFKKVSVLLVTEFLSLCIIYVLYFYFLTYFVNQSYGIHYTVPRENLSYSLTSCMFLLSICSVRVFIMLIRMVIHHTNRKLIYKIERVLSYSCEQVPHITPYFKIYPYMEQYKKCFELIRFFNDCFGLQVLIINCASFLVLIINMYLSTIKLNGTPLEFVPTLIIFFRYIANTSIYLVSLKLLQVLPVHILGNISF